MRTIEAILFSALLAASGLGCSSAPQDNDEGLAVAEDGLTSSDVAIVGDLQPLIDPAPIHYANPTRYRALRITSVTTIDELDLEISAENGQPQAWIVDASFRALVTSTTVTSTSIGGAGARVHWRRTSLSSSTYYLLLRETSLRPTVFHVKHKCDDPPPPPPPPTCQRTTCAVQGKTCGSIEDHCGGTLDCGTCSSGSSCVANTCVAAPPKTCPNPYGAGTIAEGALCNWAEENANQGHPEGICVRGKCHQGCFIDGKYYWVGQQNPANPCQICDPTSSTPTRVGWSDVQSGYESYYPTCTACSDHQGKRTIPAGSTCFNFNAGRSGTCTAGKCN